LQHRNDLWEKQKQKHFSADTATDIEQLRSLCQEGVSVRYQQSTPIIRERINHELDLISRQGFAAYFLINWDIVRYARSQQYFYVGRGSGANSLVAYLLGITNVDPLELDLYLSASLTNTGLILLILILISPGKTVMQLLHISSENTPLNIPHCWQPIALFRKTQCYVN
jgi:hypothetical protein